MPPLKKSECMCSFITSKTDNPTQGFPEQNLAGPEELGLEQD